MVGLSQQHSLAKWLSSVIESVLQLCFSHCVSDSFTSVDTVGSSILQADSVFLCFFDVSSLFANVALKETINICANALNDSNLPKPLFPQKIFTELVEIATTVVECSFNEVLY